MEFYETLPADSSKRLKFEHCWERKKKNRTEMALRNTIPTETETEIEQISDEKSETQRSNIM